MMGEQSIIVVVITLFVSPFMAYLLARISKLEKRLQVNIDESAQQRIPPQWSQAGRYVRRWKVK